MRMRSSRAAAGSSWRSCGTSSPRKALHFARQGAAQPYRAGGAAFDVVQHAVHEREALRVGHQLHAHDGVATLEFLLRFGHPSTRSQLSLCPLLPPRFSISLTPLSAIPRSTALHMS